MSTIYDHNEKLQTLNEGKSMPTKAAETSMQPNVGSLNNHAEIAYYQERTENALKIVDDIVLKNYLTQLSDMPIIPIEEDSTENIILYKVNKMVYEKDEYATDKFISVVSAMTYTSSSIYLIIDGHRDKTDFYLGIKCNDENRSSSSVAHAFHNAILGQFPGAKLDDELSVVKKDAEHSEKDLLLEKFKKACSISSCVGVPAYKNSKGEYTNANFIQGIEKFTTAMQGKEYTAIVLASNTSAQEILNIRKGYENIYTELSTAATQQLAYSTNESLANSLSRTKGYSDTTGQSETRGSNVSRSQSHAHTEGTSKTITHTEGESKENKVLP